MALDHERMAPCHQPKRFALAKVMRNAGSGAATDWNTIRQNESTAACLPYFAMNSRMTWKSPVANVCSMSSMTAL